MKINELLNEEEQLDELLPQADMGQTPKWYDPRGLYGQGKQNRKTLAQDKQLAKQLYTAWNGYAVRINKSLGNDPNLIPTSIKYFKSFISKMLRIPPRSEVFDKIDDILGNGTNYNKATAQAALDYAVAQRAPAQLDTTRSFGTRGAGNPGGNPPSIPANTQVSLPMAGTFTWTGSNWVNASNNQPAPRNLIKQLNQKALQQLGSQNP
jgi:hypothetical protein